MSPSFKQPTSRRPWLADIADDSQEADAAAQKSVVEENHLLTRLRVLNQVAQVANNELRLPFLVSRSLRELERFYPLHVHSVWLVDADSSADQPEFGAGGSDHGVSVLPTSPPPFLVLSDSRCSVDARPATLGLANGRRLNVEETPFGPCLRGESAYYADLKQGQKDSTLLSKELAERGASFFFAVPLRSGKRAVGVLQIVSTCSEGFTNEHVQIIYLVADLLGPAISNCQLVLRLRTANQSLRATQEKLVQSVKMRALGELAAGVAHNFNNSLCTVLGFLELAMVDPTLSPNCRRNLEASHVSALDAAQIVRRVQAFARPRQVGVDFEPLDVNELVTHTVELTRPKWEDSQHLLHKPIEVIVEANAHAVVNGTPTELREVLTNLIFNAVDAMPQGGTITIKTWNTPSDAFLSIGDTGVGMSEFVRQRLFEPLFTTKGEHGTGLGLSISFAIMRRHGGDITVESAVDQGSTFTLRLPASTFATTDRPEHESETAAPALQGLRVLVIEDEPIIRTFLNSALTSLGYRPRLASSGEEGLAFFSEESFDLVLTDVGLPGINGEEVARAIAHHSHPAPVVLLTGWGEQMSARMGSLEGVTRVLGKPVQLSTLAATFAEILTCPVI